VVEYILKPFDADVLRECTVTGVDDAVVNGNAAYAVVLGPVASADAANNTMDPTDVSATNVDNDVVQPPSIALSAISFQFGATEGGANPPPQTFTLTNGGGQPLDWISSAGTAWLGLNVTSGTLPPGGSQDITASVDITGLTPGTFAGTVTVSGAGAPNSPQSVSVTLAMTPPVPVVAIDSPTADPQTSTLSSPVLLGGTAANSPARVTWVNAATSESGAAAGTDSWTASVPLVAGDNPVTIFVWNTGGVSSDSITVTYLAETEPPVVTTSSSTYAAASASFVLNGQASDSVGVSSVAWTNATTGAQGTAAGTAAWSASLPLTGGENTIVVTATDAAGNQGSRTVTVLFTTPADAAALSVLILAPTTEPTCVASALPMDLGGMASDAVGISRVVWTNDGTGRRGTCEGTTSWTASVGLASGSNVVRVTTFDPAGNSSTALVFVTFRPPSGDTIPPYLAITAPVSSPSFVLGTPKAERGGIASDDVEVGTVVWSNATLGLSGSAFGSGAWKASIPLAEGANSISVTAYDTSGNKAERSVTVEYQVPKRPPDNTSAGNCGSVGLDLVLPLALLWLCRRASRGHGRSKRGE
jgi:hypothetical protein